jgi:stage V sporulation protein B
LFLPKKLVIKRNDLKPDKSYISECLSIGIPNTTGRLIGSFGYFLEPIILSLVLLSVGYDNSFITREYGILSGYVMPLVLLPSFFTLAISQALLPVVSREYSNGMIKSVQKKIRLAIFFSLVIGIPATILFVIKPGFFLRLIYHTSEGISYMRIIAPVCLLQYIQAPLSSALDAMGKSRDAMIGTTLGMIVRTSLLFILSYLKIGCYGLIIAISINVFVVTIYDLCRVRFHLKKA